MGRKSFKSNWKIKTKTDLMDAVEAFGFLPFFMNSVKGFSIEEHVDPAVWFTEEDGPWEWKGPVIRELGCAYGKFFERRAAYISRKWFPDFANYRRDGYDFDARFDDGLASYRDRDLFLLLDANAPILSKRLKAIGNYKRGGKKGFDTVMTRLQAQCYVVISDFVYETDRTGRQYGWGVAEYSTPERFIGEDFSDRVYLRTPEESRERVLAHLHGILPDAEETALRAFLR